jgi:hypothetical protein
MAVAAPQHVDESADVDAMLDLRLAHHPPHRAR